MTTTYYATVGDFESATTGDPYQGESGRRGDFLTAVEAVMPPPVVA